MPNPLSPALYARIRPRRYAADRVVTFYGNDVVLSGRVTSDLVTPRVWAEFNYDMATGDYTDVRPDMYLIMGTVDDITQATYIEGRTRYDTVAGDVATASKIYCNESSEDFLATVGYFWILNNHMPQIRLSTEDQATQTQKADWNRPYEGIPPRISGVRMVYADYVNPLTGKLRIAVDMSSSAAQESGRSLSSILTTIDGATVLAGSLSGYMFIVDVDPGKQWAETTLVDNGGVSQTRYWFIHAADDDNPPDVGMLGNTIENRFDTGWTMTLPAIAGVDDLLPNTFAAAWRTNQQTVLSNGTWVTGDLWGGASADITNKVLTSNVATLTTSAPHTFLVGQSIVVIIDDTVFNGTFTITAVTANTFSYAKTHANVGSAAATGMAATNADNVDFGGWMQTENDTLAADMKYSVLSQANFNFTGIGPRMAKLFGQQLGFLNAASATTYEQIVNCTPYRVIARFLASYTTVATLANIDYDAYDNTYLFSACIIQAQDMLSAIKALLYQINANPEWSGNGGLHIGRDATYLDGGERAPLTVLLSWTSADPMTPSSLTRDIDPNPGTGKVDADGTFYQTDIAATGQVFTSRAPGTAQGAGSGNDSLRNQILAATSLPGEARDELGLRAGSLLDFDNLNEFLHCVHRDATVGLADWASRTRFYWWILAGDEAGPNGVNRIGPYDTLVYWLLDSRTSVYNPDGGTFDEKRDFRRLIAPASPGDDTTQTTPDPGSVEPALPDFTLPAFPYQDAGLGFSEDGSPIEDIPPAALLPQTGSLKLDGNEIITWSDAKAYLEKNVVIAASPTPIIEIGPSDLDAFEIQHICASPFSNFPYTVSAVLLANDGTDSAAWYAPDAGQMDASWTEGDTLTGEFKTLRATNANSGYLAYSPADTSGGGPGPWEVIFDFATSQHGWYLNGNGYWGAIGSYVASTGWESAAGAGETQALGIRIDFGNTVTIDEMEISKFQDVSPLAGGGAKDEVRWVDTMGGTTIAFFMTDTIGLDTTTYFPSGSIPWTGINIIIGDQNAAHGPHYFYSVTIRGNGTPPILPTGAATVVYTDDNGATWGTAQTFGSTSVSYGGMDAQSAGEVQYASAGDTVYKASTLGGPFSPFYTFTGANVAAITLPYYGYSGGLNTSTSTPDVLIGLDDEVTIGGDTSALWFLEGDGTTIHALPPASSFVFVGGNPNAITASFNTHIAVTGEISGTPKCYRTVNLGVSWQNESVTSPSFIRVRRQDESSITSGSNKGQLFIIDNAVLGFSKVFALNGFKPRTGPASLKGLETLF